MVVVALLVVVLTAVLSIADGTQKTAAADQERTSTLGESQAGIARIAENLRNACYVFSPGGANFTDYFCRTNFTTVPGTSACTRSSDCIDFIGNARTSVPRPTGAPVRTLQRVRIDCGQVDPASTSQTRCTRFTGTCTATSCPSPTAVAGVLVRSIANGGAAGSPANVFVYCTRDSLFLTGGSPSCSATPATAGLGAIQISLAVSRRGQRFDGGPGSFYLQEGAELKNINQDAS